MQTFAPDRLHLLAGAPSSAACLQGLPWVVHLAAGRSACWLLDRKACRRRGRIQTVLALCALISVAAAGVARSTSQVRDELGGDAPTISGA
jgi:hypothetical protein